MVATSSDIDPFFIILPHLILISQIMVICRKKLNYSLWETVLFRFEAFEDTPLNKYDFLTHTKNSTFALPRNEAIPYFPQLTQSGSIDIVLRSLLVNDISDFGSTYNRRQIFNQMKASFQ